MPKFYLEKPSDFIGELEVSTVFMECNGKLLLLCRSPSKLWAVPGGKLEKNETPLEGLIREIQEELHLNPDPSHLVQTKSVYVRHPKVKYHLHLFTWTLDHAPNIILDPKEHCDFLWQPIAAFSEIPLLEGQLEAYNFIYKS